MGNKLYHSIGEVAEMFHVNASLLRFWEKEFNHITPFKNTKGTRYYTIKDIEDIRQVFYLTKECGFTIEGAREQLKTRKSSITARAEAVNTMKKVKDFLLELKKELE